MINLFAKKTNRVWEVDAIRGLLILFVVWDHFMWDVNNFGMTATFNTGLFNWLYDVSFNYYNGALRVTTHDVFVTLFVLTSGISCSFSHNNFMRGVKLAFFAVALSAVTTVAGVAINFNVIHVLALSVLIWAGLDKLSSLCNKPWQKNVFGVSVLVVTLFVFIFGYTAQTVARSNYYTWFMEDLVKSDNSLFFFLYQHSNSVGSFVKFCGGDYLAFLPSFGWFVTGAYLGKWLYPTKTTKFPTVNVKYVSPLTFIGRNTLWVYFGSQIVMYGGMYLLHVIFNVL